MNSQYKVTGFDKKTMGIAEPIKVRAESLSEAVLKAEEKGITRCHAVETNLSKFTKSYKTIISNFSLSTIGLFAPVVINLLADANNKIITNVFFIISSGFFFTAFFLLFEKKATVIDKIIMLYIFISSFFVFALLMIGIAILLH